MRTELLACARPSPPSSLNTPLIRTFKYTFNTNPYLLTGKSPKIIFGFLLNFVPFTLASGKMFHIYLSFVGVFNLFYYTGEKMSSLLWLREGQFIANF